MALSLTATPDTYSLSGHPVIFALSTPTTGVDYHKLHVKITYDGDVVGEDALPVISGKAVFDISDYLKEDINGHFTIDEDEHVHDIIKEYSIEYFETYDYDGLEHENEFSSTFYIIQGKFDYLTKLLNDEADRSFNYFFYQNTNFLTYKPTKKYVQKREDDILYILTHESAYNVQIEFTLNNGDTEYKSRSFEFITNKILEIPAGYNNLVAPLISAETWKDDIFKYQLSFYYDTGSEILLILSEEHYVKENSGDTTAFVFKNTLGVYEVHYLFGVKKEIDNYEKIFSSQDDSSLLLSSLHSKSIKMNTGWISEDEYNNFLLLLNSKDVIMRGDVDIPVIITSNKTKEIRNDEYMYSLEIEFQIAYIDKF